jgi:hypothetical protein
MAPIWIRKHTTLIPSVFVIFLRIFEFTSLNSHSSLDVLDPDRERERDQEERRKDSELAAEVALRKRSTNERGIKLTVVLMASRKMLGMSIRNNFGMGLEMLHRRRSVLGCTIDIYSEAEWS